MKVHVITSTCPGDGIKPYAAARIGVITHEALLLERQHKGAHGNHSKLGGFERENT